MYSKPKFKDALNADGTPIQQRFPGDADTAEKLLAEMQRYATTYRDAQVMEFAQRADALFTWYIAQNRAITEENAQFTSRVYDAYAALAEVLGE